MRVDKNALGFFPGQPGNIFNGICDWVYEEEVISDTRALWFSPDSNYVTWIEFNDTDVGIIELQVYGPPGRLDFQYPIPTPLKYVNHVDFHLVPM